jgi:uncharacterized membrane protein
VHLSNALERMDRASEEAAGYWPHYLSSRTRWNHVGTAALRVATLVTGAFTVRPRSPQFYATVFGVSARN